MHFPDERTAGDFLAEYWQKQPLFLPAGVPDSLPMLDGDELAWLATLDDVESRLIFSERSGKETRYRVEHGPFDDQRLASLPGQDWTLLINDVEKHLPELRAWLSQVAFVPDWRVDDLMLSFAAPGGSVGPHRDNYDVFLCQGHGGRDWRIASNVEAAESAGGLSLLQPFEAEQAFQATTTDALYLPPGIGHWGIASDACVTYSIGMRAPTLAELQKEIGRLDTTTRSGNACDNQNQTFYADADLQIEEAGAGKISTRAVERVQKMFDGDSPLTVDDAASALGCAVTSLKPWLVPDAPASHEISRLMDSDDEWPVHGMSRLAWFESGETAFVFVNGAAHRGSPEQLRSIRTLAATRICDGELVDAFRSSPANRALILWMLEHGIAGTTESD